MFNILLLSFISILFHLSVGKIFSKYFNIDKDSFYDLSLTSLIGLISLSFFSLLLNFFLPLNQLTNTIVLILLILTSISTSQNLIIKFKSKNYIKFIFFTTVSVFLIMVLSNTYAPDGGMYHFPYINILNE